MIIAFLSWILCSEVTFDVSRVIGFPYVPHSDGPPLVHLERKGDLSEHIVRFWMAELTSALVYLHKRRIIHRYASLLFPHLSSVTDHPLQRYKAR
jgi:serine/threonine protein kinase